MSPKPSSSPLNIPSGNSPITPDAQPSREEDRQTGDRWRDIKTILSVSKHLKITHASLMFSISESISSKNFKISTRFPVSGIVFYMGLEVGLVSARFDFLAREVSLDQ
jgi:hypothetical protein